MQTLSLLPLSTTDRKWFHVELADDFGSQVFPVIATCEARAAFSAAMAWRKTQRATTPRLLSISEVR